MAAANSDRVLRLVIIDSDKNARAYVKRSIGKNGIRIVGEAENVKSGLRLVRSVRPDVLLMELPAEASHTMEIVKKIREELPNTGIIISSYDSSPQLILSCFRAGAQEFVARPIDSLELEKAVDHMRRLFESTVTENRQGTVVSVFSSKGGVGATSVAVNLGLALAERPDTASVLVDLSFQLGDLGLMLDCIPRCSLTDAFEDGSLDESKLRSLLVQHSSGVHVLTVAASPEIGEEINRQHMAELLGALAGMFDYVIVDVGRHLDDRTVEVLELSNEIFLMLSLDVPAVRNVNRYLGIFDQLKIERDRIRLVVNRFDKKTRLKLADLEDTLQLDAFWLIPNDFEPMSSGIDGGVPVVIKAPRSKVAQSFKDLAARLSELREGNPSSQPSTTATT
jgi:pilus assembly protein CpaE